LIQKTANTQIAAPGSPVTFTIVVTNPGPGSLTNVFITDDVPSVFIINSVSTSKGTYHVSGNTITFSLGTLTANQSVTMTVATTVSPSVQPPLTVTNTAIMSDDQNLDPSSSATVRITKGFLPSTGEHPDPVKPILPIVLIIVVVGLMHVGRRKLEVGWQSAK
jgi:uncharacterized repeat protein (TIGR01451 family)